MSNTQHEEESLDSRPDQESSSTPDDGRRKLSTEYSEIVPDGLCLSIQRSNISLPTNSILQRLPEYSRFIDVRSLSDLFIALARREFTLRNDSDCQEYTKYYDFPRLLLSENNSNDRQTPLVLQPSLFHSNKVPPTIYFNTKQNNDSRTPISLPRTLLKHFKWRLSTITPNSIRHCINFTKLETLKSSNSSDSFLGSWCKHMLTSEFLKLEEWRKVNHFPGSFHMGRKDKLWMRLNTAMMKFGIEDFGEFHPRTFVLPRDYEELRDYWSDSSSKLFIMKPPASSRGNGIKVINDISQIPSHAIPQPTGSNERSTMIIQRYISNPCLLENRQKFDLRIYVLLTSVDPLRVYVYKEGLVRFASSKYTIQEDGIIDQYMHLTNYFINKNSIGYKINNDCDSLNGSKWTLTRFWRHLEEHYPSVNTKQLWSKIIDIIVKTVISCESPMYKYSRQNCKNDYTSYELFGFDIILDEDFKPWILEVNITPSLKSDSDLDAGVKYRVIKDMLNLVGYHLPPSTSDECRASDHPFWFDNRLYVENLIKQDRLKHIKFLKYLRTDCENDLNSGNISEGTIPDKQSNCAENGRLETDTYDNSKRRLNENILDDLTQNDIRILMISEDELSRKGDFIRVFPSSISSKYLRYFEKPRYYNLLLDAWEQSYQDRRLEGILNLSRNASFLG